ncbi:MAG: MFS transporter, partial [Pseudomonadota bacterium]
MADTHYDDSHDVHEVTIDEVVTTVIMARVTDFFGFFVYAIASAVVFPTLFFPNYAPVTATLLSFGVFSLAFIARPIASLIGRSLQKKVGRGGKIVIALMVLGTSTVAIGLLPGYESIGWWAPALLAALRFVQGLGLGGAWDGITMQLQSAAPDGRRGFYGMIPQLGGPIGFCVAAALFYVMHGFLTEEEFMNFGWRFAFFAVMAVNVVSLFARIRLLSADFGGDSLPPQSAPLSEVFSFQKKPILISTFMPLAAYSLFHMVTVFPLAYAMLYTDISISEILLWQMTGGTIGVFTVFFSGWLSDKIGRPKVLMLGALMTIGLCFTITSLDSQPWVFILAGFALLGLTHGSSSAIAPARFLPQYRYSGVAMSTNLSWIFGAAFAPLIGLALTAAFGLWSASLY